MDAMMHRSGGGGMSVGVGSLTLALPSLALLAGAFAAAAEPAFEPPPLTAWQFEAWPLPDAGPHPVAELPDGTLAVGSSSGLVRFDGRRFRDLPAPRGGGGVLFLHLDRAGVLHVVSDDASHAGISADEQWMFATRQPVPPGEGTKGGEPTSICEAGDGSVWVGHRNGLVSRTQGRELVWLDTKLPATSPDDPPAHVAADRTGRVWMARKGCLAVWHDGLWQIQTTAVTGPLTLAGADGGGLWMRSGHLLYRVDESGGLTQPFADIVPTIRSLSEDAGGRLWIGTSRYGLVAWDGVRLATAATTGRSIYGLCSDQHGGLWAGTTAGLERGRPRVVRRDEMPTIKPLRAVASAADGTLWFITLDGELGARGADGAADPAGQPGWKYGVLTALASAADGTLWLGTQDGGVIRMADASPKKLENLATPPDLRGLPVHALAATGSGGLWAALGPQLVWTDGATWHRGTGPATTLSPAAITLLAADQAGGVWAAAADGQLAYAPPVASGITVASGIPIEARNPPGFPAGVQVTAICPLDTGSVWIVTRHAGLWRYRGGRWSHLDTGRGLPSATLLAAQPDDCGRIWFAGSRVFFTAAIAELEAAAEGQADWVHCFVASGENDLAFFDPAIVPPGIATRDRAGRVLVVLPTGLAICEPQALPTEASAPAVRVVDVRADGRLLATPRTAGYAMPSMPGVTIPADTRVVSCTIAEPGTTAASNARVQHRLEGIDPDWLDTPGDRIVAYDRLPAGRHALRLRSSTTTDAWHDDAAGFVIDVEPRLWERPWFRGAVVAGAALLAAAGVYARQAFLGSLAIARVRQAAALDRERMRIARDMHDELGTSLTQISLLTELIRGRADTATADQLEGVTTIARDTVAALDEIVWAVNPKHDTLAHLLSYVALQASQALGRLQIECDVEVPERLPARTVPAEFRRAVLAIVKEAVGNVIRHAAARHVRLVVRVDDAWLGVTITDDGRGLTAGGAGTRPREAAGLDNMRQRAADLGGTCEIGGRAGGGTAVELRVPLPAG